MKAGFAIASKKSALISRAKRVLEIEKIKPKRIAGIIVLELLLFIMSYLVIIQPYYNPYNNSVADEIIIDNSNAYLKEENGEYKLYINGDNWGILSEDETNMEPYCRLEIRR